MYILKEMNKKGKFTGGELPMHPQLCKVPEIIRYDI
jgi:hypothetical protein